MKAHKISSVFSAALLPRLASHQTAPHTRRVPETKIIFGIPVHDLLVFMELETGGIK